MRCTVLVVALLVYLTHAPAHGEPVVLATGGKPAATIIIPADPHARLSMAAQDLQSCVEQICGVRLPIRRDGKRAAGCGLYIGPCEPTMEADFPAAGLNPETYAIHVRQGSVFFTGRWPTPTWFAVVSFLESNLGVRWFAPGDLWQYVPPGRPGELVVEVTDVVKAPDTSPRVWSGHAWFADWQAWNLRNKTVLSEVVPRRQFQNFLYQVFPPEQYARQHPEYYPLIKGRRWIPKEGDRAWRPCESNPDVLRITIEYARRWLDEHATIDSFSLGMDDISHLCQCPNCRAMDPRPDSYEKQEFSDRHYKFVNAVARELKKTHPDRYVGTLIYNIARRLPETVPQLEDNVFGYITEESADWWRPGEREADHELTRQWAQRCKHLSRYDYYGLGGMTPRVYPHAMDEQIKFDKSLGLEGMYVEVYTFLPHTAPMIWALAKLQWDHRLDIDRLLEEFYVKMYGEAAPVMKQYFDLLERSWNTPRPGRRTWVHRNLVEQALAMSPEDVDQGFRLLEQALAASRDEKVRQRIEIHRAALQYSSYVIYAYAISQRLVSMPVEDGPSAQEAVAWIERLTRLIAERQAFWPAAAKRDDLLGETLRGLGERMGYLSTGQIAAVEHGGMPGAMKVLAWCSSQGSERLATFVPRLSRAVGEGTSTVAGALLWVQQHKPENRLRNGDFEAIGADKSWTTWTRTERAQFEMLRDQGQNRSCAVSIAGADGACYLQTVAVQPGERYLCLAWAKANPSGAACGGRLAVRFRDLAGRWLERTDLEPKVLLTAGQAGWQPLALVVTVPEDGGGLTVMLGAERQVEGARVLFDNVALYRLPHDPSSHEKGR